MGGQHHAPAALPPGKTRYPLYSWLGRPQGRSGRVRKISSPPGFDPRTVQPVRSRYTDWAIAAHTSTWQDFRKECNWAEELKDVMKVFEVTHNDWSKSCLFVSDFPTKTPYTLLLCTIRATCPARLILLLVCCLCGRAYTHTEAAAIMVTPACKLLSTRFQQPALCNSAFCDQFAFIFGTSCGTKSK